MEFANEGELLSGQDTLLSIGHSLWFLIAPVMSSMNIGYDLTTSLVTVLM